MSDVNLSLFTNKKNFSALTKHKQHMPVVHVGRCLIDSFLASGDFGRLLVTFANSLDPDQNQLNDFIIFQQSCFGSLKNLYTIKKCGSS